MPRSQPYHTQSGNILVYILGAIFLLGVLTAMVRGSNTPGGGIDEEALIIRASEIQQYGQELERAISYIYQNGHSEADIRFAHPDADSAYGVITDTPTRQVFSIDGGGATYREPPSDIQTTPTPWVYTGANRIPEIGTNALDIIALLPNVTADFCLIMNETNNIENPLNTPPTDPDSMNITTPYDGNFSGSVQIGTTAINGLKQEGCLGGGGTPPAGTYHYYRVLLPR